MDVEGNLGAHGVSIRRRSRRAQPHNLGAFSMGAHSTHILSRARVNPVEATL
jgi:hypothetical protein